MTKEELAELRKVIREEVEADGMATRREFTAKLVSVDTRLIRVEDRSNGVEVSNGRLEQKIADVDLKVEAVHEYQKKAHAEIIDKLVESNEINGQEQNKLKKRLDRLEDRLSIHNN